MKKFDAEKNIFLQNGCFVNNFSELYQISLFMRIPAFCIFCGLFILTSFSLLTVNVRGVTNKHCLLPFFIYGKVKFGYLAFLWEKVKTEDFSETITACDLKVGRCRQLIEIMKVCEY